LRAELREEGGEEPVECDGPEDGAEVFVEEPWEVEWEITHGEADGDGDEEKSGAEETAAMRRDHGFNRQLTFSTFVDLQMSDGCSK
jgi:hypothetical protein